MKLKTFCAWCGCRKGCSDEVDSYECGVCGRDACPSRDSEESHGVCLKCREIVLSKEYGGH